MRPGGSGIPFGLGPSLASERHGSIAGYVDWPVNVDAGEPGSRRRGAGARRLMARAQAAEKRRTILDAAVKVFARQGFHACRVSDIADEAGVAYGLVYHYFSSKDEILDTLFLERWDVLLETIREVDARDEPARDKLEAIAGFIVDSYRHDPDLMKVIIVEVTRAANSFGRTHLGKIREAYGLLAEIVAKAQADGEFTAAVTPEFAALAFYGEIEQVLTGWIFDLLPIGDEAFDQARAFIVATICDGLAVPAGGVIGLPDS
jgi:AcrR family transcriptional regulator